MPETRSAAEAFNALRAEVRETHAEIRTLKTRIAGASAPNYDLTLGEMAKRLGAMEDRLIHLACQMPPARLPGERTNWRRSPSRRGPPHRRCARQPAPCSRSGPSAGG